jgi:hypothetical protein
MANIQVLKKLQESIASKHHLVGGAKGYRARFEALHGGDPDKGDVGGFTAGKPPEGFGPIFDWDREQFEKVNLSTFINPADALGVMITGAKAQDRIMVTSASGLGSFTRSKGSLAVSIIGLVSGVAGGITVFAGGNEKASKQIVDAVNKFAEREFENKGEPLLIRDAFGIEPSSQNSAKREGGVLISLPAAQGPYYSGSDDKFNLKSNKPRTDSQRPAHVRHGFFLVRGDENHMSRPVGSNGEIFLLGWDHKFEDNAGFYQVRLTLIRDGGVFPNPT